MSSIFPKRRAFAQIPQLPPLQQIKHHYTNTKNNNKGHWQILTGSQLHQKQTKMVTSLLLKTLELEFVWRNYELKK